jgi:hypothetical protein
MPAFSNSARTCCSVFPSARASVYETDISAKFEEFQISAYLSQKVGENQFMVNSTGNRIVCLSWGNEVTWNRASTLNPKSECQKVKCKCRAKTNLVNELVESMLAVCAGFTLRIVKVS